jgi:pimeloyl-ACP methyl ester carboxylesterase
MKLFSRELGEGGVPLVILHGLFGMSDNWLSLGRRWAESRKVILLDLRNHGLSPASSEWTYKAMASDVIEYLEDHKLNGVHLLGHSMGGKTAMCLASERPELLNTLTVVDIGPKQYPVHHRSIVDALLSVPVKELTQRQEVEEVLSRSIKEIGIRQFLMKSLHRLKDDGFEWRFNLEVIERELENVGESLPLDQGFDGPSLFVRGEKSSYILDEDLIAIHRQFPMMKFKGIHGAGHWVHAEKPEELFIAVSNFMEGND